MYSISDEQQAMWLVTDSQADTERDVINPPRNNFLLSTIKAAFVINRYLDRKRNFFP